MELRIIDQKEKFFGGKQAWFSKEYLRQAGCGIVGAANVICSLEGETDKIRTSREEYHELMEVLKYYLPIMPWLGLDGFRLALGMNIWFLKHHLPFKAMWGISGRKLFPRMHAMLTEGIPVILGIGRTFPNLFSKRCVDLYVRNDNEYVKANSCSSHFVTVYGMEGEWLMVSSWGQKYYVNRRELEMYISKASNYLFCNILYITKRNRK